MAERVRAYEEKRGSKDLRQQQQPILTQEPFTGQVREQLITPTSVRASSPDRAPVMERVNGRKQRQSFPKRPDVPDRQTSPTGGFVYRNSANLEPEIDPSDCVKDESQ